MVSGKDVELAKNRLLCEGWDDSAVVVSDMEKIIKAQVRKQGHDATRITKLETAIIRERAISIEFAGAASSGRVRIVEPEETSKIAAERQLRKAGII